ncbi:MAG: PLP-dependent aminotransferase family protein [Aquabacterium sp.]|nr:PLP-dependent aminotransferase family protein [Aquabacterium sp.]
MTTRYESYADDIRQQIATGLLRTGDRLPSVRQACAARGISPATVFGAYYLLESEGLIESRPRSGYYVARPRRPARPEPRPAAPKAEQLEVDVSRLVQQVLSQARQPEIVPLGSAFPSPALFPLDKLAASTTRALRRLQPQRTVEHLAPGSAELRRQIALRYLAGGSSVTADEIVVCNGAMEALNLCLEAVTEPGDLVAIESPAFYGALQALERRGLRAIEVTTHPRTGVDVAALARVLDAHPVKACWFMPNFQNPLGCLMPDEHKQALVALLAARGIPLIEDDVYAELYFGRQRPRPAKAWDGEGLVMHCSSFSKCLAPGWRVGWVAGGRFAQAITRRKLSLSLGTSLPAEEGLADYLAGGGYERHLRRLRETLCQAQTRALRLVCRHFPRGTRITRPTGGYFLWVEMPAAVDALALHRLALEQGIGIAPGQLFSADGRHTHCLRLNYGHPAETPDESIRRLGELACRLYQGAAPASQPRA